MLRQLKLRHVLYLLVSALAGLAGLMLVAHHLVDQNIDDSKFLSAFLLSVLVVTSVFLGFIAWFFRTQVVNPVGALSDSLLDIIDGDLDRSVSGTDSTTEIGAVARAIDKLRETAKRQQEIENALAHANEELKVKAFSAEDLHLRAEKQAANVVAMAEDLAFAKEEAELATKRAEIDENRVRTILNTVTDAIVTIDMNGMIETFNPAAERMFGYPAENAIGQSATILMPETERSAHSSALSSLVTGRPPSKLNTLMELVAERRDGSHFPCELTISQMTVDDEPKFTGVMRDITERKAALDEIRRMAMTDSLTSLANRNLFQRRLDEGITLANRGKNLLGLMLLDLDKFKPVNDTYGHPAGDKVLLHVAEVLNTVSRDTDTVARLGGDEFAIVVVHPGSTESVRMPAQRIIDAVSVPMNIEGSTIQIGISIGISFFPNHADNSEDMIKCADTALYEAKASGRNTYRIFEELEEPQKTG